MGVMYRDQGGIQPRWVSKGEVGQEPQRLSLFARNSTNAEPNIACHPVILPFFLFWQCPQLFPTLRLSALPPVLSCFCWVSAHVPLPQKGRPSQTTPSKLVSCPISTHCPHHACLLPQSTDLQEVSCLLVCYPHQRGCSIWAGNWSYSPIIPLPGTESLHKDSVKEPVCLPVAALILPRKGCGRSKGPSQGFGRLWKTRKSKEPRLFGNPFGRKFCNESDKSSQGCFSEVSESMLFASRPGSVTAFSPVPALRGLCDSISML